MIWQAIRQEGPPPPEHDTVVRKLRRANGRFAQCLAATWPGGLLARAAAAVVTAVLAVVLLLLTLVFILFPALLRALFPTALNAFQPLGPGQTFHDHYWRSLCMDNTADDILLGTAFTETWVPITYTERAMTLMRDMFAHGGTAATGYYSTEVYGAGPSSAWLSPAYSGGPTNTRTASCGSTSSGSATTPASQTWRAATSSSTGSCSLQTASRSASTGQVHPGLPPRPLGGALLREPAALRRLTATSRSAELLPCTSCTRTPRSTTV